MSLLTGCNGWGLDFADTRTIAIQKSPYLVVASGDVTKSDVIFAENMVTFLSRQPYRDHNFTDISVHVIGAETEIDSIDMTKGIKDESADN